MKMWKILTMVMLIVALNLVLTGCRKPPLVEKFDEIKNNETAFVVQLEGDKQAKLDSSESLRKMQVSTKRINIPQRFKKTGRYGWEGEWIPTVKIMKLDRTPITQAWSADSDTGTSEKNQGIWIESRDSIGFSTGFNCTAMVTEEDAATFLYLYPGGSLQKVMDAQIRNEIQAVASEAAAQWKLDECREKKLEIIAMVRKQVVPKFEKTGITITTIGMFGGFAYEEVEIQTVINKTFIAQQEKVVAAAELEAQEDKNNTIMKAAIGIKQAEITKAEGDAQSIKLKAEAEASAILSVAKASQEANSNPLFLELKKLEVEMKKLSVWDGKYPQWYMGSGQNDMDILIQSPLAKIQ